MMMMSLSICPSPSSAFREQLQADILAFNLTDSISSLEQVRDALATASQAALVTSANAIITQLEDIRDNQLHSVKMNAKLLETQVDELSDHIDGVVVSMYCSSSVSLTLCVTYPAYIR